MTGHIRVPALAENDRVPATMSHRVMTDVLRKEMGFDGVAISDEIRMKALSGTSPSEAAIAALHAGADMILVAAFPRERERLLDALLVAQKQGRLPAKQIDASLRRILRLKYRNAQRVLSEPLLKDDAVLKEISARAVTLLRNANCVVPIDPEKFGSTLLYIGPRHAVSSDLRGAVRVVWANRPEANAERRIADAIGAGIAIIVFAAGKRHGSGTGTKRTRQYTTDPVRSRMGWRSLRAAGWSNGGRIHSHLWPPRRSGSRRNARAHRQGGSARPPSGSDSRLARTLIDERLQVPDFRSRS